MIVVHQNGAARRSGEAEYGERARRIGVGLTVELARALAAVRRARGLRQVDVAVAMGTSQSCVSDFERGKANPQLDFVARYAAAVNADITFRVHGARPTAEDRR